jgi:hypothetical protein
MELMNRVESKMSFSIFVTIRNVTKFRIFCRNNIFPIFAEMLHFVKKNLVSRNYIIVFGSREKNSAKIIQI